MEKVFQFNASDRYLSNDRWCRNDLKIIQMLLFNEFALFLSWPIKMGNCIKMSYQLVIWGRFKESLLLRDDKANQSHDPSIHISTHRLHSLAFAFRFFHFILFVRIFPSDFNRMAHSNTILWKETFERLFNTHLGFYLTTNCHIYNLLKLKSACCFKQAEYFLPIFFPSTLNGLVSPSCFFFLIFFAGIDERSEHKPKVENI